MTRQTELSSRPNASVASRDVLRSWSLVAGCAVAIVGLSVMIGWFLDVESLTQIGPGLVVMKFNTAFCLALLGAGVAAGAHTRVALVASLTVGAVGTVTLVQYVTGWSVGIDEALYPDSVADTTHPGRMAVVTAVCLSLGVVALLAIRLGRDRLATGSALLLMTLGWLGCLGYLFGVRSLYDVGDYSTMAAHTAAAIVILGLGLLASTPGGVLPWIVRGDDPGATMLRRILPIALVVVPVVAQLTLYGQHAGWYQTEVGLAFMVVVASSGVSVVAMHMARVVNRAHAARALANEELLELNSSLEARIEERTADLVTSEAWARVLAWSAPVGIYHTDIDGQATYVNDRWCEIYGISVDEGLADGWESGVHAEDRPWVLAEWATAIAGGTEFDCEFRVVRPTGEVSWVHSHSARVHDVDGAGAGYVGTTSDVTARRQAELSLRATEELFRITFGSSPIGMALVDANGLVVRANRALGELTQRPLDELLTMRLQSILHPDNVGNDERRASAAGPDQRILRADGSVCWASIRYARITGDGAGESAFTIVQFVDTTDRRESEDRLAHMANHDSLTGLMNRRSLEAALEKHVVHCNRYGPAGAVLILDLDNFKRINDSRGHSVGDQVIVTTARLLSERLRESDFLARLGGDEFAVLLTAGDWAAARVVAQSLVEDIRAFGATIAGEQIALSASIGVAVFDDVDRSSVEMLANADFAMYDAKSLGRDRWAEYASKQNDERRSKARLTWINRIEADIDNDAFVVHAQPIVDLDTGETVQLELLIRMFGDRGDLVPPDSFLYIAERYGLSNRMDAWVLGQALDLLETTSGDTDPVTLAVNLSGTSIGDDQLLATLERRVGAGGFAAERLVLQVAEPAATSNIAAARALAERFRDLGCRLTFGSLGGDIGSVCYLEHLPFDFIRLDGELVTDCIENSSNRVIIGSLVDLARSLGKETIAEQVSSERVRQFLRQLGVDHGQGFELGLPVPLEEAVHAFRLRPDGPETMSTLAPAL